MWPLAMFFDPSRFGEFLHSTIDRSLLEQEISHFGGGVVECCSVLLVRFLAGDRKLALQRVSDGIARASSESGFID